jgi:hypothetical protein
LKAGVEPRFQEWNGKGSLVAFVVSLNVKRRHLASSQLAAISLDVLAELEKEASERRSKAGGDKKSVFATSLPQNFEEAMSGKGESSQIAAKMLNTNRQYVIDAKKIAEKAPNLLQHVKDASLTACSLSGSGNRAILVASVWVTSASLRTSI